MAIRFTSRRIDFDPTVGRTQVERITVPFTGTVRSAGAALKGFDVTYNNGDHELLREVIDLNVEHDTNSVTVTASLLLRDSSGNIDDPFSGHVECLIIADVV
jgi:hypothetical protein